MGEQTLEDIQNCMDSFWQDAEAIMRRLQALKPTCTQDAMQIGKAIAMASIAKEAMQAGSSTLGRTTKAMWKS